MIVNAAAKNKALEILAIVDRLNNETLENSAFLYISSVDLKELMVAVAKGNSEVIKAMFNLEDGTWEVIIPKPDMHNDNSIALGMMARVAYHADPRLSDALIKAFFNIEEKS